MRALVLLHGFTGSPASFDDVAGHLPASGAALRLLRPRLLGHGVRPALGPSSFVQEVDRIASEVVGSGFSGAHLCGYSLGARIALGLLARHASLFAGATLIGVHPGLSSVHERACRIGSDEAWCELLLRRGLGAFVTAWEAQPIFASRSGRAGLRTERQRAIRLSHEERGLARSLRVVGLGQMPSHRGVLGAQPVAVCLMVGSLDSKFLEIARQLAAGARRVTLEVVEGAGHDLPFEAPGRVADVLTRAAEV